MEDSRTTLQRLYLLRITTIAYHNLSYNRSYSLRRHTPTHIKTRLQIVKVFNIYLRQFHPSPQLLTFTSRTSWHPDPLLTNPPSIHSHCYRNGSQPDPLSNANRMHPAHISTVLSTRQPLNNQPSLTLIRRY